MPKTVWLLNGESSQALSKPLFAIAPTAGIVLMVRVADRIGKGVRGAPRDALVADITPPHLRGAAYGLRQSLDTVGAFFGPLLAVGLMLLWADNFRRVFWVAVIPGLVAVALLISGIREPARQAGVKRVNPLTLENLRTLSRPYWVVVSIGAVFALARFSEAFLVLRAMQGGITGACTSPVQGAHLATRTATAGLSTGVRRNPLTETFSPCPSVRLSTENPA
jgi:predicted MFS family arabinose efflux permease